MTTPLLTSIWAQDRNGVIGSGTSMLWTVPGDLRFFQSVTVGSPVIMGRASWEALREPLPGRENIVITRQVDYFAQGIIVAHSIDEAVELATRLVSDSGNDRPRVWVTGGAQVYANTINLVDELVVTFLDLQVNLQASPIVRAPRIDPQVWQIDPERTDPDWRPLSGDARWRVSTYVRVSTPE